MQKPNYEAWDLDLLEIFELRTIEDKIRFLVKLAVLAPSSHNSQPWEFEQSGRFLIARLAPERLLSVSDPTGRQAYISLGCALENILVGAEACDLAVSSEYLDDVVRFEFLEMSQLDAQHRKIYQNYESYRYHLCADIRWRATDRGKYKDIMPNEGMTYHLMNSSFRYGVRLNYVVGRRKYRMADVVVRAMGEAMANSDFRDELSKYVISNISKSKTGMPGFSLGMPTLVSLVAPKMLKHFNLSKLSRKQDLALLRDHTPVFAVISTLDDNPPSWIRAGKFCQRVSLEAVQAGLKTSIMAAAVEVGDYYKELQAILQIKTRPQVFMRLGYSDNPVLHSPRLSAEEVLKGDKR